VALSKTQSTRLGVILSVMSDDEVPPLLLAKVVTEGFVRINEIGLPALTESGLDEKNRLCTLAGLNIKYLSERSREDERFGVRNGNGSKGSKDTISAGI